VRKSLEEIRAVQRKNKQLLEELAELQAAKLLAGALPRGTAKLVSLVFADRDAVFIKLVAQKIAGFALETGSVAVILLGGLGGPQPALVFAQTTGGPYDMGKLMKEAVAKVGGRGGGNKEMARGGAPAGTDLNSVLVEAAALLELQATSNKQQA
jgi:alanyl-tRNA synthetase